jgi:uncharacterized metal-binding protein YceD (DUF177 family)
MRPIPVNKMAKPTTSADDFIISMAKMPKNGSRSFDLQFGESLLKSATEVLGLTDLRKTRITGTLSPEGHKNWRFQGQVGASVTQECVVSLQPVKTRIDVPVTRLFLGDWQEPDADSVTEMTLDEDTEPLGREINLHDIALEAIALALPDFPRAPDATLEKQAFAEPGITPMSDEDAKPFAGLAALKDKMLDKE